MIYRAKELLRGVWQITGEMGVCCTLLAGEERALLVDAGYGLGDIHAYVRTLTDKPVQLLLTHGHHDHALGAMHFSSAWLFPEDEDVYRTYTGEPQRRRVADSAQAAGIGVDRERFLTAAMAVTAPPPPSADLGGMTARILLCPGHTPGSAVVHVPERGLLITGDDWNPVTWCFFPEALPVREYRENVRKLADLPFRHVMCSHRENLWPRKALTEFLDGLTDECLNGAEPSDEGKEKGIETYTAHPAKDQILVFDHAKGRIL